MKSLRKKIVFAILENLYKYAEMKWRGVGLVHVLVGRFNPNRQANATD